MHRFAKFHPIIFLIVSLLLSNHSFSQPVCSTELGGNRPSLFSELRNQTVVSLYINRNLISQNQTIELNSKKYIVRDWYKTENGPVLIVETFKKRKSKLLTREDFGQNLVVIDTVSLSELLSYRNERVINRYMKDFNASQKEAETVFLELMKWFYMLHRYSSEGLYFSQNPKHFELGMYDETQKIDDMWHTFILFTIDYSDFGWNYLGYYQHHQPFDQKAPQTRTEIINDRQRMYDFMSQTVGEETVRRWFKEMEFKSPTVPIKDHVPVQDDIINRK